MVLGVGLLLNASCFVSVAWPGPIAQIATAMVGLAIVGLLLSLVVAGPFLRRRHGPQAQLPTNLGVVFLLALIPTALVGAKVRELRFTTYRADYESSSG
jgi:branched-subunit amino acid ABC-type transport system permease component